MYGGGSNLFQIGTFAISFIFFSSFFKSTTLRISISICITAFIALQLASLYATKSFIGYGFYVHFNLTNFGLVSLFLSQLLFISIISVLVFASCLMSYTIKKKLIDAKRRKKAFIIVGILTCLISYSIGFSKSSFIEDTQTLSSIIYSKKPDSNFNDILEKHSITNYTLPHELEAKKGKNIIIISLESFEKGFLDHKFRSTTPNLQRLKKEWSYLDIHQNPGSNWTSGSLYTLLTGFPAFFGVEHNEIFQNTFHSEITSISHVTKKAGYQNIFLNSDANFSGTRDMLYCLAFDKIIDKSNTNFKNLTKFGVRDYDLFQIAKEEVKQHKDSNKPYMMILSTTDTHFPRGFYDERLDKHIKEDKNSLKFMLAGVDYMIKDFIQFLDKNDELNNTAVYILPDHFFMGNRKLLKNTGELGLYLISNQELNNDSDSTLYQVHLPKIILNSSGIIHNMSFFTDYINGDKNIFIKKNIAEITEINTSGLQRINKTAFRVDSISKNYQTYIKDPSRYIAHAGGSIDGKTYTNSLEALNLSYSKGFKLFEIDITKTRDGHWVANHDWNSWKTKTNFTGMIPPTLKEFQENKLYGKFTPMNIDMINQWFSEHPDAILVTDKINEPKAFVELFIDRNRLMMEVFTKEAIEEALEVGVKVIPTHHLVDALSRKDIEEWSQKGVHGAAISRTFIRNNREKLLELKKQGIHVYAYHINFMEMFDEEYVTKYEMDYIYGIYADNWNFNNSIR